MNEDEGSSLLGIENETVLRELLKKRFSYDKVNNFIDDILVSFNPCKSISHMDYTQENAHQKVAASAINHLQIHKKSQCVVVTGDSGSGKTVVANKLIAFITMTTKTTDSDLAKNITQAGQLLESFGNACTLTSNNASRFIKLTELLFTQDMRLKGVCLHHYLLEKTRVVQRDKGEKNFHIFYQFLVGTTPENLTEKYHLEPSVYHRYTGCDFDITKEPQDKYKKELRNLNECFESLGFSQDNIETIFRLLAAILHIGDVVFCVDAHKKTVEVSDCEPLQKASSLLRVSPDKLKFSLATEMTYVKGRIARRARSISEASNARDMLAMALYSRLFAWIVWKINLYLSPIYERDNALSILDPFGFERLNINGFEQLCINTTNEHLMFLYNQIVFAWETADQQAEGILIQKEDFPDNKEVMDFLMERPNGIFSLLEQESKSVKGSDASLVKSFSSKHRKHDCYSDVANSPYPAFTINHYAGKVTYAALNLLTRNRNMLGGSIITCLQESQDDLLCRLFMVKLSPTGAILRADQHNSQKTPRIPCKAEIKKMRRTIRREAEMIGNIYGTTKTKNSLSDLMQRNLQSELHFVRCIRPNQELIPNRYDDELVSAQLKYSGIMESVRMRQNGFSVRISFKDFIERYKFISYQLTMDVKYNADTCEKILSHVHGLGWRIGKTKVFMKNYCREQLNGLVVSAYRAVVVVQNLFRGRLARRWYNFLKQRKQREKHDVTKFLSQVISDDFYSHLCNQVSEEDARANCSDIKPDEDVEEKAIQILEGNKIRRNKKEYKEHNPLSSTPILRKDAVDGVTTKQASVVKEVEASTQHENDLKTARNPTKSSHKSPLVSVSDIFTYGLVENPASPDTTLETANPSVNVFDVEGDDFTHVFNSTDNSNEEANDGSLETPLSITDAMTLSPDGSSTPLSITDWMTLSPDDSSTPLSITDAMTLSPDDSSTPLSITDAMALSPDGSSTPLSIADAMTLSPDDSSTPLSITDWMALSPDADSSTPMSISDWMTLSPDDKVTSPNDGATSPVRPSLSSKESNLSTFSFDTTLSVDDDMDVAMETPGLWCVITCFERDKPRGDFQVDRSVIVIDGSSNAFDVTRIGLGSLPMNSYDEKVEKVRHCIGKGIKLTMDVQGNMWVKRCSKNRVYVKGRFLPPEIQAVNGELPKEKLLKVFDFESFSDLLQYECEPMRYEPGKGEDLLSSTKVHFSFVKNAIDDVDTPCWIEVRMTEPYRITQVALDVAKERRRIAREKRGERTPPILRAKIGKSRKVIAVGALEKKVRPQRYIDTFKYGRKGWARKKVSVNPFAFGEQDLSPGKEGTNVSSRERSQSSPVSPQELERSFIAGESSENTLDEVFEASPPRLEKPAEMKAKNDDKLVNNEKTNAGKKIWAKEKLKAKNEQKKRVRSKTTS